MTAGGFRGDYNCALEPMTSFYDSVANAEKSATLRFLNPGESIHFDIDITFLDTEKRLSEFSTAVRGIDQSIESISFFLLPHFRIFFWRFSHKK